jgi:hypothetical protein
VTVGAAPAATRRDPMIRSAAARHPVTTLFLVAFAAYAALAVGTGNYLYTADSDSRFINARYATEDPGFILDTWNKPMLTGLAAGVVALGGGVVAVKVLQGFLAALALALVADAARRAGAPTRDAVTAAALAGLSPFWVRLVFSVLTELSCAVLLAAALNLWARRRYALAALAVSLSFLARFEGFFFALALLPFLIRKRSWLGIALLAAGPLAWNLAGWATTGAPAYLLTREPHDLSLAPHYLLWWLMPAMLALAAGALVAPALARPRSVPGPALAIAGVTLLLHSIIWTFGFMDSGGRPRYLVTIIPALAFAAAFGLERFGPRGRAILFGVAAVLAACVVVYRPNSWAGSLELARTPGALTSSPTVKRLTGAEGIATWREAPPGTLIAWESGWAPGGAFDQIPAERLTLLEEFHQPKHWPWERDWVGRVYRLN